MKKIALFIACATITGIAFGQQADSLQKLARMQMQQSKFDEANKTLMLALQQKPNDLDLLKDQEYGYYLSRDYVNSLQLGKSLTERPDADEQCFQMLGMTYKALAENKEAEKMYKAALKKFPNSGVLYGDYGDLLAGNNDPKEAIGVWERGISLDVNNNNNYYYAAKYYAETGNIFWSVLYGEIFVNIESYTDRTTEIKELVYDGYKKLFTGNTLAKISQASGGFEKAVTDVYIQNAASFADTPSVENISIARAKFTNSWFSSPSAKQYPCRLFDLYYQAITNKFFGAYNEWLFGPVADYNKYEKWSKAHGDEMDQWQHLHSNVVFKIPAGQYYGVVAK